MNAFRYEVIVCWDKLDAIFVAEVPGTPRVRGTWRYQGRSDSERRKGDCSWVRTAQEDGLSVPELRGKLMYA